METTARIEVPSCVTLVGSSWVYCVQRYKL